MRTLPKTEYAIYKMYRDPEYWDGPFKTLAKALAVYRKKYPNQAGPQDFQIYKIVLTPLRAK